MGLHESDVGPAGGMLRRLAGVYRGTATFLLSVAIVFLLANFAAAILLAWLDGRTDQQNPVSQRYGDTAVGAVYGPMTPDDVRSLLAETWSHQLVFEPFTLTREQPFRGHYVNVDSGGFRHSTDQGPWPPDPTRLNVFLFGGSTTFSYGLPDDESVASYLQSRLRGRTAAPLSIYNFGRAWYYSTQERILFEQLLLKGFVPDIAVFLDGLNDFEHWDDKPYLSGLVASVVNDRGRPQPLLCPRVALCRFAARVGAHLRRPAPSASIPGQAPDDSVDAARVRAVIRRMDFNRKAITAVARAFDIPVYFVIQPVPTYGFDLDYHPFARSPQFDAHRLSGTGYLELSRLDLNGRGGPPVIWCAGIQEGIHHPLYVDGVHYSAELADMTADCIAQSIETRHPARITRR